MFLVCSAIVGYGLLAFCLNWLFPKGTIQVTHASAFSNCSHQVRQAYEPEYSVGDESDYRSRCVGCGRVLRWEPNA